jgi:hypothetical protein
MKLTVQKMISALLITILIFSGFQANAAYYDHTHHFELNAPLPWMERGFNMSMAPCKPFGPFLTSFTSPTPLDEDAHVFDEMVRTSIASQLNTDRRELASNHSFSMSGHTHFTNQHNTSPYEKGGWRWPALFCPLDNSTSLPWLQPSQQSLVVEMCPNVKYLPFSRLPFCPRDKNQAPAYDYFTPAESDGHFTFLSNAYDFVSQRVKSVVFHTFPKTSLSEMTFTEIFSSTAYQSLDYGCNRVNDALRKTGQKFPTRIEFNSLLPAAIHSYYLFSKPDTSSIKSSVIFLHFTVPLLTTAFNYFIASPVFALFDQFETLHTASEFFTACLEFLDTVLEANLILFLTEWSPDESSPFAFTAPLHQFFTLKNFLYACIAYHQGIKTAFKYRLIQEITKNFLYSLSRLISLDVNDSHMPVLTVSIYKFISRFDKINLFLADSPNAILEETLKAGESIVGLTILLKKGATSFMGTIYQYSAFTYTAFTTLKGPYQVIIGGLTSTLMFIYRKQIRAGVIQGVLWLTVPIVVFVKLIGKTAPFLIPRRFQIQV